MASTTVAGPPYLGCRILETTAICALWGLLILWTNLLKIVTGTLVVYGQYAEMVEKWREKR